MMALKPFSRKEIDKMAHEIEGNRFAFRSGSEVPWHVEAGGIRDNRVPDADCFNFQRFLTAANMNLTYEKFPVGTVPNLYGIRRNDGLVLDGVGVGSQYNVLQPIECFEFFDPFLQNESVILDTAAVLRQGSRFYVNAKINMPGAEIVPGDTVHAYLLFCTSVDGSLTTTVKFVNTRTVCANTQAAALQENTPHIRVKHTKNQRIALEAVRNTVDCAKTQFVATVAQYRALQRVPVIKSDVEKYIRLTLDFPQDPAECSTKANNIVGAIQDLAADGLGTDIPGVRGTAWGAYNALTEYLSHHAGRNEWSREDSLMFGEYAKTGERALVIAGDCFARPVSS
jgi:phage/plasmid-like protein (TIGR03299 family)